MKDAREKILCAGVLLSDVVAHGKNIMRLMVEWCVKGDATTPRYWKNLPVRHRGMWRKLLATIDAMLRDGKSWKPEEIEAKA